MKVSPFIIGAALLFWGIETDNILIGTLLALVMEGSNLISNRYTLAEEDFIKVSDLTSLIFLGAIALILINYESVSFLRITGGWLPLILSPLIVAQLYSTSDKIIIGTRLGRKKKVHAHRPIDCRFHYISICIFAAATANSRSIWFFPAVGLILASLLYQNRGRSYPIPLYILLFAVALAGGYASSTALQLAQSYILNKSHILWRGYYREQNRDPYKSYVSFGETRRLKQSGEIIMRVDASINPPHLFSVANYSLFTKDIWLGNQGDFVFLPPVQEGNWNLINPPHEKGEIISVEYYLPKEKGLLPYPRGGYHVSSKTIFEMEKNKSGVVKIMDGTSLVSYDLLYNPEMIGNADLPTKRNLTIPDNEKSALQKVLEHINVNVSDASEATKISAIEHYFQKDFRYSLKTLGKEEYETPLANFLLNQKKGFCEYYATATALLLRLYGIPSRYVVGYAILEKSWLERKYVVRTRHAHAWVEAFVDNKWVAIDTTPSNWPEKDIAQASVFEKLTDVFSLVRHKYRLYRIGSGKENTLLYSVIVIALTTFLVFRIYRRMKIEQVDNESVGIKTQTFERIISPLTPLIDAFLQSDDVLDANNSLVDWVSRKVPTNIFDHSEFENLYRLHLKMRYDPKGLNAEESERLQKGAVKYLDICIIKTNSESACQTNGL